jgi:hypothetical protein
MIQVRIITLTPGKESVKNLLRQCQLLFPEEDVALFPGFDARNISPKEMYRRGYVSLSALKTLLEGRKWHSEAPSAGAIGIHQSVLKALKLTPLVGLLLLEDDCVITDGEALKRQVCTVTHADVVACGVRYRKLDEKSLFTKVTEGEFMLMHCVYYTPRGRQKLAPLLEGPLSMQIDASISWWAYMGYLDVLVCKGIARQRVHISSIQEAVGVCALCHVPPSGVPRGSMRPLLALLVLVTVVIVYQNNERR